MIWIEILSRHRDVTARFRIAGPEASIGRGYDNDVIVDDPYVAAQHLRIFRDETGQLVAEDMGSANGLFLDGGKSRQTRIVVDGSHPIRIGQTFLRIRETSHAVERERVARPERRISRSPWPQHLAWRYWDSIRSRCGSPRPPSRGLPAT